MLKRKKFYEQVGQKIGWDFSELERETIVKNKKWDFFEEVSEYLDPKKILLDLGAGSGEKLFKITDKCKGIVGIDSSKSMICQAKRKLRSSKIKNIKFKLCNTNKISFESESFDVVTSRHSPFNIGEVARVLKKGGIFLTQQVGERDKQNIKDIFKRGQSYNRPHGKLINSYIQKSKKLNLKILRKDHYHSIEYYNMNDIIFLLEYTPIIPSFSAKKGKKFLELLKSKYEGELKIKTNSCRYLLVLKKE